MTEPDFFEFEEVLALHERELEAFGGTSGIRDQGLLESAMAGRRLGEAGLAAWMERQSRGLEVEGAPR